MKGVLSYVWVNMRCANCMMTHPSAVNGNVNSYSNAPNNLNCMWLTHLTIQNCLSVPAVWYAGQLLCGNIDSWWDAPGNLVCCSQLFIFLIQVWCFCFWMLACYSIPFKHPILEEVFVHSKVLFSVFLYHKHCTSYGVSWQIKGFYAVKLLCLG